MLRIGKKVTFFIAVLFSLAILIGTSHADILGWEVTSLHGVCTESDGVITLSGDEYVGGPGLSRDFKPQTDFELSLELKAETLGEVDRDPLGAGEGFGWGIATKNGSASVIFEMRARGGGQFLLVRHNYACDLYGWACDWTPFVYNSLAYNNGYAYWHPDPPVDRSNALVRPDVWYTLKLKVKESPFTVTAEVYNENGILLGALTINDMNNIGFKDIECVTMSSGHGGTFYVRNFTAPPGPEGTNLSISTDSLSYTVGSTVDVKGTLMASGNGLTNTAIACYYTFAGADVWYPIGSAVTNAAGEYRTQWLSIGSGTFTLKAQWKGNASYEGAEAISVVNMLPIQSQSPTDTDSTETQSLSLPDPIDQPDTVDPLPDTVDPLPDEKEAQIASPSPPISIELIGFLLVAVVWSIAIVGVFFLRKKKQT